MSEVDPFPSERPDGVPKLFTHILRPFHTNQTWLSWHAETTEMKSASRVNNQFALCGVVYMMGINPIPEKNVYSYSVVFESVKLRKSFIP